MTDSIGSFVSSVYSTLSDNIHSLTSNTNGDTLYFLQNQGNFAPSIMMLTTNNLSPSVIGSIPLSLNKIKEFKYYDGSFYIINSSTDKLYKFTNGNFTEVTLNGNDVLAISTTMPEQYYISENYWIANGPQLPSTPYDLEYSLSDNSIYIKHQNNGVNILKYEIGQGNHSEVYLSNGLIETNSTYFNNPLNISNDVIYFSAESTLLSVRTDGTDVKTISSTSNSEHINGIVVFD